MILVSGMMKSGKSSYLQERAKEFILNHQSYIIIRPKCDNRKFFSRNDDKSIQLNFGNERNDLENYKYIMIDEAHLYDLSFIKSLLKLRNKNIIIAGLILGTDNKIFDYFNLIYPYLKEIKILKSRCDCCSEKEAKYHKRIGQEVIGDNYLVLCEDCF